MIDELSTQSTEATLMGAMLWHPEFWEYASFLEADDFLTDWHRAMWLAIRQCFEERGTVTVFSLRDVIKAQGFIADEEAAAYVDIMTSYANVRNPENVVDLANLIRERAIRRRIVETAEGVPPTAESTTASRIGELAATIGKEFERLSTETARTAVSFRTIGEAVISAMSSDRKDICPTGLTMLDRAMAGGLYLGKAYGLMARKKAGKTTLATTISYNLNQAGIRHAYVAAEMGAGEITQRMLARALGCNALRFVDQSTRNDPGFQAAAAMALLEMGNSLEWIDAPGITFDELQIQINRATLTGKCKGFILDYLQLVGGQARGQSQAEHLDDLSEWIAYICRKRRIWALVLAQTNQQTGNVRGGEGMRMAFDQVYELMRPDAGSKLAWIEMRDTRYTEWGDLGDELHPNLRLNSSVGPYFEEIGHAP